MPDPYLGRKLSARYPVDLKAWQALKAHFRDEMRDRTLTELFKRDKFLLKGGHKVFNYHE